jgi:hypothetical protein
MRLTGRDTETAEEMQKMNENLEIALRRLRADLDMAYPDWEVEAALFGSVTLVLRDVIDREVGDIDMFVSKRVWGLMLPRARWRVLTPKPNHPPILAKTFNGYQTHLFFDWSNEHAFIDPAKLMADSEFVQGWPCATIEEVLRHKKEVQKTFKKHEQDITEIERHMTCV